MNMSKMSGSCPKATSAIAGLSILELSAAAHAQGAFGNHADSCARITARIAF